MSRIRISTTVNATLLATARRLNGRPDSRLLDAALGALIDRIEGEQEMTALANHPYDTDPDLAWVAPPGPPLAYDGTVPEQVLRLAQARRKR